MALRRRVGPAPVEAPTAIALEEPPALEELVIESRTGKVRQAGADAEGAWLAEYRVKCERSLYLFTKGILKRNLLSATLHKDFCQSLQAPIPPYRRQRLLPRGHLKSSIVSEALPMHLHIQPLEHNLYWPDVDGSEMNVILAGEKKDLMGSHLRWIKTQWESNKLLRALWPHRCWTHPARDSKKWNEEEFIIPRTQDYADPSVRVIGVDGAITGAHARVLIKDDLISLAAANSPTVMQTAIDWHIASRALLAPYEDVGLEFTIGTRWAVNDLYSYIQQHDDSVDHRTWSIIQDDQPIWPEQVTLKHIAALRKEYGTLFHLLYINNPSDPELTDFALQDIRLYRIEDGEIVFEEDDRDLILADRQSAAPTRPSPQGLRGTMMTREVRDMLFSSKDEYLRFKR